MNLNYHLDLQSVCNLDTTQFMPFFTFALNVKELSRNSADPAITEEFFKDESILSYKHKSKVPLVQVLFNGTGELYNRLIPAVWNTYQSVKDSSEEKFGTLSKESPDIHPNAKITSPGISTDLWMISESDHYYSFRNHHINRKIISKDCEDFLPIFLPKIEFTKKALAQYKKRSDSEKKSIISDLNKLNGFIDTEWGNGDFPIEYFSKISGVSASDESDTTKRDPKLKELRKFSIPDVGSTYCFLHIKLPNLRIHFYPDLVNKKAYIAYIGKHLKTAKF